MIKLQISGGAIIYSISQVQEIPSRNGGDPFRKRELILDDSWSDRDGVVHPNYVLVEFTGDKMSLLDNFQPGQRVNVDACVNGREYNGRVFTSIKGLGITPYQEQPQQGYAPSLRPRPALALILNSPLILSRATLNSRVTLSNLHIRNSRHILNQPPRKRHRSQVSILPAHLRISA